MAAAGQSLISVDGFGVPMPMYPSGLGGFYTVPFYIDFAKQLAAAKLTALNPSSGDFIAFAKVPIGAQVHGALIKVELGCNDTLGTGTILAEVGDYSAVTGTGTAIDSNGYLGATPVSLKTTGTYFGSTVSEAYMQASKVYNAAEFICLTLSGTAVDVIIGKVWILLKVSLLAFPDLDIVSPAAWH